MLNVNLLNGENVTTEELIRELTESETGLVLVSESDFLRKLATHTTFEDRQALFGMRTTVAFHLFPLYYNSDPKPNHDLIRSRQKALNALFWTWDALGYNKRQAKSPFNSKAFSSFLEEIKYHEAEYMLATA